jgi:hypothetical protein
LLSSELNNRKSNISNQIVRNISRILWPTFFAAKPVLKITRGNGNKNA